MEPVQINASNFERSEKALEAFFRDNSGKLPGGITLNLGHKSSNGKIKVVVWSYQSDSKHVEGAVRKMEKDFKLSSFGPLEKNGRGSTYYSSTKEMSIDEFANFLRAVNEKGSEKLIESVRKDYETLEIERKKEQDKKREEEKNAVPKEVLNSLKDKIADVDQVMRPLYPGNTWLTSKAYGHFSDAERKLEPGVKLDTILEKVKQAIKAFDEEEKDNVNKEKVAKIKLKLVGLQGALENAIKMPVEGKGQPPKPTEPGKQVQPSRP
jgi:hypothetical protein